MLSNAMRSLEMPDMSHMIPLPIVGISNGRRGRVGPEPIDEQDIILWQEMGQGDAATLEKLPLVLHPG
jgi:hypothetical protein